LTVAALCLLASAVLGFEIPSEAGQLKAIGSLKGLSDIEKCAFTPGDDFAPIRKPGQHDWLVAHPEPGQTYAQFKASRPNRPDETRKVIYLQPLGLFPANSSPSTDTLKDFCGRFFEMEVRLSPPLDLKGAGITSRINRYTHKRQLITTDILEFLKVHVPDDAYCVIAITMEDLYPEASWNYVFGQASLGERVGVYSFARYDPAFFGEWRGFNYRNLILRRSVKVLAHETGHMYGIGHCVYFDCLMNGANHMEEADAKPLHLCPMCLRKLHSSVGFDIVERYRGLKEFYAAHGIPKESAWISRRLGTLAEEERDSPTRVPSAQP